LSGLMGGGTGGSSSFRSRGAASTDAFGRNTGSRDRGSRFGRTQDRLAGQQRTPGRSRSETGFGNTAGPGTVDLGEDLSVTADPATNTLIIHGSKTDYGKILELIKQLDVKRRQVLVEAMLLEVGIDDSTSLGTEWL